MAVGICWLTGELINQLAVEHSNSNHTPGTYDTTTPRHEAIRRQMELKVSWSLKGIDAVRQKQWGDIESDERLKPTLGSGPVVGLDLFTSVNLIARPQEHLSAGTHAFSCYGDHLPAQ